MKTTIVFAILFASLSLSAGYSPTGISEYFSDGKVYYRGIYEDQEERRLLSSKMSSSRCVNLQVFDLDVGKTSKVFEKDLRKNRSITGIVFERPLSPSSQNLYFGGGHFQNQKVGSNVKDRIIIIVYDSEKETSSLWSANRLGKELKEITQVTKFEDWHIDLTNQKIRVFSKRSDSYQMREYPW
ncbi:MAG: hypothetical protein AAF546_14905 [Verrucomicrobiota bacterium]